MDCSAELLRKLSDPDISRAMFYPRIDSSSPPHSAEDLLFPAGDGIELCVRHYRAPEAKLALLYFHGNGEIASDYDDLADLYAQLDLDLLVADYRGYGKSTGEPTLANVLDDASLVWDQLRERSQRLRDMPFVLMGRSLGSAPATFLASRGDPKVLALVIESGFASFPRVLRYLGIANVDGDDGAAPNLCFASRVTVPTLVMHGEIDDLIPVSEARDLYKHLGAKSKSLVEFPYAGHNDILYVAGEAYFSAIAKLLRPLVKR